MKTYNEFLDYINQNRNKLNNITFIPFPKYIIRKKVPYKFISERKLSEILKNEWTYYDSFSTKMVRLLKSAPKREYKSVEVNWEDYEWDIIV